MGDSYFYGAVILAVAIGFHVDSITIGFMVFGIFCVVDGMISYLDGDKK